MLTQKQKDKADDVTRFQEFEASDLYKTLRIILEGYRVKAIAEIESDAKPDTQMEGVRKLHAANSLIRHINSTLEYHISDQLQQIADAIGVDVNELMITTSLRREIEDE